MNSFAEHTQGRSPRPPEDTQVRSPRPPEDNETAGDSASSRRAGPRGRPDAASSRRSRGWLGVLLALAFLVALSGLGFWSTTGGKAERAMVQVALELAQEEARLRAGQDPDAYAELFVSPENFVCWFDSRRPPDEEVLRRRVGDGVDLEQAPAWESFWLSEGRVALVTSARDRPPRVLFVEIDPQRGPRIAGEAGADEAWRPLTHLHCASSWDHSMPERVRRLMYAREVEARRQP